MAQLTLFQSLQIARHQAWGLQTSELPFLSFWENETFEFVGITRAIYVHEDDATPTHYVQILQKWRK